jgi:hypothetical protein
MRCWFAAALLAAGVGSAAPSAAQQAQLPSLALRYPTDSGKPMIFDPPTLTKQENDRLSGCAPGLQCRFRLLGVIQNNGAVELRGTAFTW